MYAAPFEYHSPATVAEALALLDRYQDEAKVIAGSSCRVTLPGTSCHVSRVRRPVVLSMCWPN